MEIKFEEILNKLEESIELINEEKNNLKIENVNYQLLLKLELQITKLKLDFMNQYSNELKKNIFT